MPLKSMKETFAARMQKTIWAGEW